MIVDGVFQPEELSLFRDIFDEAVSDLSPQMRTPVNQARIAKQILDCAATGERDPMELRVAAALNDTPPINASRTASRQCPAHDSGSVWIAIPSL